MVRDLDALTARAFDVLVIGGGICGLAVAYDAAQRGLSVALVERGDFGGGASFNHLRTIHGGLRYLQTLDIGRARESVRERRAVATIAPHAVTPLAFVLPLSRSLMRGPLAMRVGLGLDRLVAADRNQGVLPSHYLPAGAVVTRTEAERACSLPQTRPFSRAARWYDYVTLEPDRLTLSFALAAARHGAVLANYVEAHALVLEHGRVTGARVADVQDGGESTVRASVVVNATGGDIDRLLGSLKTEPTPMMLAMNLVTRRPADRCAIGGQTASARNLFLVPWRGRALFGTWESDRVVDPQDVRGWREAVPAFIAQVNEAFPAVALTADDVTFVHRGTVPARVDRHGRPRLQGGSVIRDHAPIGAAGLLSVAGTKYTTARRVAERVTDVLVAKLGRRSGLCRTATTPLPGGRIADLTRLLAEAHQQLDPMLGADSVAHLVAAYGTAYDEVAQFSASRPEWRAKVSEASPVIGGQLAWAAQHEMVTTLADAVIRRTPLGALGHPGAAALSRAARIVGETLGWRDDRQRAELDAIERFYSLSAWRSDRSAAADPAGAFAP